MKPWKVTYVYTVSIMKPYVVSISFENMDDIEIAINISLSHTSHKMSSYLLCYKQRGEFGLE